MASACWLLGGPDVVRIKRLVRQWRAEYEANEVPKDYWERLAGAYLS